MQVNLHNSSGNQFTHYTEKSVTINNQEFIQNILVTQNTIINDITYTNIHDITLEEITKIVTEYQPDIIIFGTGARIEMPNLNILHFLQKNQIGFEVMPIAALCRTFNYLIGEGRNVMGIILFN
ncbi:MAG: MTH938/NDUFAF3 family protein [Burkholderiales bacterium]|nr:MTH938/NDUFAF3 family protein [Burkholderiales bacterium]